MLRANAFESEQKLRYQAYRCEYLRYEAYRWVPGDAKTGYQPARLTHSWIPPATRSRLQATSLQIGESFPIPEIVAIGGQSDGKSSLLEAFLGVRALGLLLLCVGGGRCLTQATSPSPPSPAVPLQRA